MLEIPDNLQVVPREYQLEGAHFLAHAKRAILADEQGTGKTGQAYMAWRMLGRPGPLIILARANAQTPWLIQAPQWGVQTPLVISGTPKQRAALWSDVNELDVITTTFEAFHRDVTAGVTPKRFGCIIYDQYQRLIINRKVKSTKFFKQVTHPQVTPYVFLLSGSPLRRGFGDLWSPLNVINHQQFSSYWRFVETFGLVQRNQWGAWEVLGLLHKDDLIRRISPFYLRREKKDVLSELPPKTRVLDQVVSMTQQQQKLYTDIEDDLISTLSDGSLLITPNHLSKLTRLRQTLVTPKILDPQCEEYGALLENLGDMLEDTDDHHFVIFTPFTSAIPHIQEFLALRGIPTSCTFVLQGGLPVQEIISRITSYREQRGIMICSLLYAEAFDLTPATWAYFLGFDWTPENNKEAEDRLHRFTTSLPVTYYYPQHVGGVDQEVVLPIVEQKSAEILMLRQSTQRLREYLMKARERRQQ